MPAYAAPSRAADLSGLPATWLATAELDGFVDENVEYAARLLQSGVSTELHVYPGGVHGFDLFAPEAAVTRRFVADRRAAFRPAPGFRDGARLTAAYQSGAVSLQGRHVGHMVTVTCESCA